MALQLATKADYGAAPLGTSITRDLPRSSRNSVTRICPRRRCMNRVGACSTGSAGALAGSRHPTLGKLMPVLEELSGKPQATVFGAAG